METLNFREKLTANPLVRTTNWYQSKNGLIIQGPIAATNRYKDSYNHVKGYDIPSYRLRRRKGELLPMTPFWHLNVEMDSSGALDYRYTKTTEPGVIYRNYTSSGEHPNPSLPTIDATLNDLLAYAPAAYDMYVQAAAAKIYSSGFDALTFLAEFTQVHRMFIGIAERIAKIKFPPNWRKLRIPRNWRSLKREFRVKTKRLANEWLEGRYGWRTLLMDIDSLSRAIANLEASRKRYRESVGESITTETHESVSSSVDPFNYLSVTDKKITVSIRGTVAADISIPDYQFNAFITAYEMVPFSFILDWVVNVGRSLAAVSFITLAKRYSASAGYRIDLETNFVREAISAIAGRTWIGGHDTRVVTRRAYLEVRTPCTVPLTPQFKLNVNPYKILDLLGIIVQRK